MVPTLKLATMKPNFLLFVYHPLSTILPFAFKVPGLSRTGHYLECIKIFLFVKSSLTYISQGSFINLNLNLNKRITYYPFPLSFGLKLEKKGYSNQFLPILLDWRKSFGVESKMAEHLSKLCGYEFFPVTSSLGFLVLYIPSFSFPVDISLPPLFSSFSFFIKEKEKQVPRPSPLTVSIDHKWRP